MVSLGVVVDTFETAITWDKFDAFYKHVTARVEESMRIAGGGGVLTSRFSHVYPDGPAPYFTFVTKAGHGKELEVWRAVKEAASQAVVEGGGTITHHHAVGRVHRAQYEKERAPLFGSALAAVKSELDPGGILNPGALLPAK
jgi:alkyldihydroxyacetonephosphate synthase